MRRTEAAVERRDAEQREGGRDVVGRPVAGGVTGPVALPLGELAPDDTVRCGPVRRLTVSCRSVAAGGVTAATMLSARTLRVDHSCAREQDARIVSAGGDFINSRLWPYLLPPDRLVVSSTPSARVRGRK